MPQLLPFWGKNDRCSNTEHDAFIAMVHPNHHPPVISQCIFLTSLRLLSFSSQELWASEHLGCCGDLRPSQFLMKNTGRHASVASGYLIYMISEMTACQEYFREPQ